MRTRGWHHTNSSGLGAAHQYFAPGVRDARDPRAVAGINFAPSGNALVALVRPLTIERSTSSRAPGRPARSGGYDAARAVRTRRLAPDANHTLL